MLDFAALQTALAGQYSLERELGRGGMGVVYLAREVRLDRLVAVKVLPPTLAARPELRERFLREARTAAQLSHPHVVPVHRVDEAGGFVYLAMGYVDGGTLADRLRARGGTLPPADVVRIVREVAWALAYAHGRGVVHRDVKPENILLDRDSGRALVADFGIAQLDGAEAITGEGVVMGSAHYMSPEQAAGEPLDGRSDLYALGVVAYQALAGRPPFEAASAHALLAKHLTQEPAPLPATVPARLARVVRQCLAKRPDERPASGEALAELLAEAAPVERPMPAPLRLWAESRDPLAAAYAVWTALLSVTAVLNLGRGLTDSTVRPAGLLGSVGVPLLLALLPLVPVGVRATVRLVPAVRAGYGIDDLRLALARHLERTRADAAEADTAIPGWLAHLVRLIAYGGLLATALVIAWVVALASQGENGQLSAEARAELHVRVSVANVVFLGTIVANALGSALGVTWPGRVGRGRLDDLRQRFWESGAAVSLVDRLRGWTRGRAPGSGSADAAPVERPTEHVIGLAADQLYAALPAPARRTLADLPEILRRLEREADALRVRAATLGDRLADLDAHATEAAADRRAAVREELAGARDAALDRRAATVAALEAIRLDLLRLHADTGPGALTEALARAQLLGGAVDARLTRPAAAPTSPAPAGAPARTTG